jgi:hypothetical protein
MKNKKLYRIEKREEKKTILNRKKRKMKDLDQSR